MFRFPISLMFIEKIVKICLKLESAISCCAYEKRNPWDPRCLGREMGGITVVLTEKKVLKTNNPPKYSMISQMLLEISPENDI